MPEDGDGGMDGRKIGLMDVASQAWRTAAASSGTAAALAGPALVAAMVVLALPYAMPGSVIVSAAAFVLLVGAGFILAALAANARGVGAELPVNVLAVVMRRRFWTYVLGNIAVSLLPMLGAAMVIALFAGLADPGAEHMSWTEAGVIGAGAATGVWLMLRLALVTPAIAAGEPLSLSRSWDLTRGNAARIGLLMLAFVLPVSLAQRAVEHSVGPESSAAAATVAAIVMLALSFAQVIAVASIAGVSFRILSQGGDGGIHGAGVSSEA